jgi:hypothetical protein
MRVSMEDAMEARERPGFEDAHLALKLYDLRREAEMRKARSMVGRDVAGAAWEDVERLFDYDHPENAHLRQVTGYWEMAASFVLRGLLHPMVYLDTCSEGLFTYTCFQPHLERIRALRPTFLRKTEEIVCDIPALRERVEMLSAMMAKWQAEQAARKTRRKPALERAASKVVKAARAAKKKVKRKR